MEPRALVTRIPELSATPAELLERWAPDARCCVMHSARSERSRARWSVLAEPAGELALATPARPTNRPTDTRIRVPANVPTNLRATGQLPRPCDTLHKTPTTTNEVFNAVSAAAQAEIQTDVRPDPDPPPPFTTGWMMALRYELGGILEPAATRTPLPIDTPLAEFLWCPDALVHDRIDNHWYRVQRLDCTPSPEIERLVANPSPRPAANDAPAVGPAHDLNWATDDYLHAVETTRAYIAAGDIFQANITRQIAASWSGSTRRLAHHAFSVAEPWYGAYLELSANQNIISLSPELFLSYDAASRRIATRPIKGTRPGNDDASVLLHSAKDHAELAMIVDLMRNDLGRVCTFGSVDVPFGRVIETHPSVHHGVAEVIGTARPDVSFSDILHATFPPGSITGAPKIRAMQIIEELEPNQRGIYCGSIGWLSAQGNIALNVAIRTMTVSGTREPKCWDDLKGTVVYGAGGGIVADSEPLDEYRETVTKCSVFFDTISALQHSQMSEQRADGSSSAETQVH